MLTQAEANHLLTLPKVLKIPNVVLPANGKYQREVESTDGSEGFVLHVNRKSIKVALASHFRQKTVGLARLCLNGGPHSNPDGAKVGRTHLHVYAEGYDDRLAMDLPKGFSDPADLVVSLKEFCAFINLSAQVAEQGTLLGGAS